MLIFMINRDIVLNKVMKLIDTIVINVDYYVLGS